MKKRKSDSLNVSCIERLRKNLKSFSNDKTPKNWYERFDQHLKTMHYKLADDVCVMNGIDPDDIGRNVDIFGVVTIKNHNNVFFDKSKVQWHEDEKKKAIISEKKSMRIRFLTYLFISLNERLDEIIDAITDDKPKSSYRYDFDVLTDFEMSLDLMANAMFDNREYSNELLRIITKVEHLASGVNHRKYNKRLINVIFDLKDGLTKRPILDSVTNIGVKIPDDLAIDGLIKIAFMLRTGSNTLSTLPRFEDIEGADLSYDLSGVVERLGHAVSKYDSSIIYDAWENADFNLPNKRNDLSEGIKSLEFVKFVLDDKNISSFINEMLDF